MIFGKKVIEHKTSILVFSTTYVYSSARYYYKCTYGFIQSTRYSFQILMKLQFSGQIFEKYSNTKFQENPSIGEWTDGQFWECT